MLNEPVMRQIDASRELIHGALGCALWERGCASGSPAKATGMPLTFARNAAIYRATDPADHLYTVVSGMVRACKVFVDGRRQIAAFYLPGDTFGLTVGGEHVFSAEAVLDAHLLAVKSSTVASLLLGELMRRELQLAQDHLLLLAMTALERVASFLLRMAQRTASDDEVELPMSRRDIADHLGLTIETVSRTLTRLEKESAIAVATSKRIVLSDRAALERMMT